MNQIEIDNTVVDVIYDNEHIYHVLPPNEEGVRGVPISQYMIRNTISTVKAVLSNLDQSKIEEYENDLRQIIL